MTTATAALDPGETIVAAMRDLYDHLREIVDRGPTDDPGLLDELGKLTGRVRSRITRARKKAQPAEKPTAAAPPATQTPEKGSEPDRAPAKPEPATPTGTTPGSPATSVPARRADATTVRLPHAAGDRSFRDPSSTDRRSAGLPLWVHALVILLMVAGVALATTVTPWAITGALAGATVLGVARRRNARRRSSWTGGAQ
jgi:hypothetical protein